MSGIPPHQGNSSLSKRGHEGTGGGQWTPAFTEQLQGLPPLTYLNNIGSLGRSEAAQVASRC